MEIIDPFDNKTSNIIDPFDNNYKKENIDKKTSSIKPLPKNEKSALKEFGLGFVSGFDQPFYTAAGKLNTLLNKIPGVNIPMPPMEKLNMGEGTSYQVGRGAGEATPYALTVLAPELAPGLTPEMATLSRMGLGGLYGGATSEDTLKGALGGAVEQGVLETIPYLGKAIKTGAKTLGKPLEAIRPKKYLKETSFNYLGKEADKASEFFKSEAEQTSSLLNRNSEQASKEAEQHLDRTIKDIAGSRDVNDIAKSLATDIDKKETLLRNQYEKGLKNITDETKDYNIYKSKTGFVENTFNKLKNSKNYENLYLGGNPEKYYTKFSENPNFENAHKLQSELGKEARRYAISNYERYSKINDLKNSLKNDISGFLDKHDLTGNLSKQYKDLSAFYRDEVKPYDNIKAIHNITHYKGATSSSLGNAFKNPKITPEGEKIPDAIKIANDLGDAGKHKIIALEMAKTKGLTPEKALNIYSNLETSGLSNYDTPYLEKYMDELGNKVVNKEATKQISNKFSEVKNMTPKKALETYDEVITDPVLKKYIPSNLQDLGDLTHGKQATKEIANRFYKIKEMSPEDALRAYNEIKVDPVLNKYIPKTLDDTFKSLAKKIAAKKIATVGAGITGLLGAEKIAKKIGGLF